MVIAVAMLLTGCATSSQSQAPANPERAATADPQPTTPARPMPDYSLDGNGLYRLLLGELAQLDDQQNLALHLFYEAHEQYPEDLWIIGRAAPLAAQVGDLERAFNLYRSWTSLAPESTQAWHGLWQLSLATARAPTAIESLQEIQARNPDFLVYIPFSAMQAWTDTERLTFYREIIDTVPSAEAGDDLNMLLGYLAPSTEIADGHWQALASSVDNPRLFAHYDQALDGATRPRGRIALMEAAVAEYPDMTQFRLSLAQGWLALEDPERALAELEKGLERNPDEPNLLRFAGELAFEQQLPQARTYFTRLLNSDEPSVAHYYLGRIDERNEAWQSAFDHYLEVTSRNWIVQAAQRQSDLLRAGHIESVTADELFERQQRNYPELLTELTDVHGRHWYSVGRYQRAFDAFSLGLREQPNNINLLYMRALSAEPLSRLDDLENDLRLILRQDPSNTAALNALGYTLVDRTDRIEEAAPMIEQAYRQNPESSAITDSLGWLRFHQGQYEDAVALLGQALEMQGWESDSDEIVAHYVEALWASGDRSQARAVAQRWLTEHPGAENNRLHALIERLGMDTDASR